MTPDRHPTDRAGREPFDPVADFFARERAAIVDRPGDEADWDELVQRSRRRGWARPLGGVAAAAALVLAVVLGTNGFLRTPPAETTGRPDSAASSGPATTSGPDTSASSGARRSTPPPPTASQGALQPMPKAFGVDSVRATQDGYLYALGSSVCGALSCPALVASSDEGRTWGQVGSFSPPAVRAPRYEGDQVLAGARFVSASHGWVYGAALLRTTDAGRTWTPMPHGSGDVLSLETDGTALWMVTGTCVQGTYGRQCGQVQVWRAGIDDTSATKVDVPQLSTQPTRPWAYGAWVALAGRTAYVNTVSGVPGLFSGFTALRVSGTPVTVARPSGCDNAAELTVVPTVSDPRTLFALCALGAAGVPSSGYAVYRSTDGGATWESRAHPVIGPVRFTNLRVTALDADRLVVRTGEQLFADGTFVESELLTSADGGVTWTPPSGGLPTANWGEVSAVDPRTVYAVQGADSVWRSTDGGSSFTRMSLR
ncbi:hypothetical protein N865_04765 [Intrasporangium oryzae NRRL B-24470]|uniref:Exo-alpha-sialidase n=1 Tax=Intrasporangium oryzae NRRL B-24470 TaxID=1386089 RepID=W9GD48_9MICO|nr:hypothetical protein [Intrasporangium oryzae]EWT02753.1 hypothetical protein N865_04765 [Intrasporangium oryzae NRRL B-24470]